MDWVRGTANLALAVGIILTLCLSLALGALDIRLFSQWRPEVPPGLPGLILALALAAGSFLFLGWRLRRGQKVRLAAFQGRLGLVVISVIVLVRQAVRLFGADWPNRVAPARGRRERSRTVHLP
jgi:drug/metabolite transporter (DMT)-like permease